MFALIVCKAEAADRCNGFSVKCGDSCTYFGGDCTCVNNTKSFDFTDNTTWCCDASQCSDDAIVLGLWKQRTMYQNPVCPG